MSQPNHFPTFNFNINESPFFEHQSSQVNNAPFPQWSQPGPRPMGSIPSPSTSVQTSMTAPNPRSFSSSGMNRPNMPDNRIDPSLALLAPPSAGPRPRSVDNSSDLDYVHSRMFGGGVHEEPWNPVRLRTSPATGRFPNPQPAVNYSMYRSEGPGSDIGSVAPRSDSGYQTRSVISNEPERVDQELPSEIFQMSNMAVNSASSEQTDMFPMPSDTRSQYSSRSGGQGKSTYKCTKCKEVSKCPSDYKKHMLKHDKPHTCDFRGCRRAATGKGFTTVNDLMRHKKSVHRIGVEKDSYQCASEHCRNKGKIWPRLDNFKQHISRMHKGEDEQDLIRRSVYRERYPPPGGVLSVAPMDTTLAGIGTEKQFAGNELDDPVSGISLTPDQDNSHWNSFDPSSQGFAIDVDRTNPSANAQSSIKSDQGSHPKISSQASPSVASPNVPTRIRQDSLSVLADVASTQVPPERSGPPSRRQLSSAPQTKSEQQRQALQKFSRAIVGEIQNAPSSDSVDLENVVLRLLYGVTNQTRKDNSSNQATSNASDSRQVASGPDVDIIMTKAEALKASQAISSLIKQSGTAPFAPRARRSSKGFSSNKLKCERCDALFSRSCDMKKHMKRHTRPYGCTYPKCHKRFGAKSDWKRHENSQHFQLESFRCQQTCTSSQTPCGELFYRVELFKGHLKTAHKMTQDSLIQHELKVRRIGKNGQGQFWCGFCQEIVKLKEKRNAAWDERFDHIDYHFNKDKRKIDEWLCVEAKKTKGEVLREMDKTNFDEEDHDFEGVPYTEDSPSATDGVEELPTQSNSALQTSSGPVPSPSSGQAGSSSSRKRQLPMDMVSASSPKRTKTELNRYCCFCQSGPWSMGLYADCIGCSHRLCSNCTVVRGTVTLDGNMQLG